MLAALGLWQGSGQIQLVVSWLLSLPSLLYVVGGGVCACGGRSVSAGRQLTAVIAAGMSVPDLTCQELDVAPVCGQPCVSVMCHQLYVPMSDMSGVGCVPVCGQHCVSVMCHQLYITMSDMSGVGCVPVCGQPCVSWMCPCV